MKITRVFEIIDERLALFVEEIKQNCPNGDRAYVQACFDEAVNIRNKIYSECEQMLRDKLRGKTDTTENLE